MKAMDLAEAKHYLEKNNIKISIWNIKQDILRGKLHAKKSNDLYWITANDLETTYGISKEKPTGIEYYMLRVQGLSKDEIIQRRLMPYYGDEKTARFHARAFEANITKGIYQKQIEEEADIQKHFALLSDRDDLVKKLAEKHSLGLVDEIKKIEEELKKKRTILCSVSGTYAGVSVQLPLTPEKQMKFGLYKSIWDFFSSHPFYTKLQQRGISVASAIKDGYITLDYAGKRQQIINTLQEHLAEAQPQGFPEARLELKLYIPPQLYLKKEESEKKEQKIETNLEIRDKWYTADEIRKAWNLGKHPQAIGGLVISKTLSKPRIIDGIRHYQILKPHQS